MTKETNNNNQQCIYYGASSAHKQTSEFLLLIRFSFLVSSSWVHGEPGVLKWEIWSLRLWRYIPITLSIFELLLINQLKRPLATRERLVGHWSCFPLPFEPTSWFYSHQLPARLVVPGKLATALSFDNRCYGHDAEHILQLKRNLEFFQSTRSEAGRRTIASKAWCKMPQHMRSHSFP